MTLIVSYINRYGIVMASDSNLTNKKGNAGFGQKVFPIPYLNAGITYSGLYEICGKGVDEWLNEFIKGESFITNTIEEFVKNLTKQLNFDFKGNHDDLALMHVCGYPRIEFVSHLEHWHISNSDLQKDGSYSRRDRFHCHNDFNSKTNNKHLETLKMFDQHPDNHQFYINGFPPARISFYAIKQNLEELFNQISGEQSWSFRPPKNLFESANKVKMYFHLIGEMFKMSDYEALFVGGEIQTYLIPAPTDLKKGLES